MLKRLVLVLLLAGSAFGQTLNMDMSWGIASQQAAWDYGQWAAAQAAQNYYDQVQQYRWQTGYTGRMPDPVSPAQLQSSIRGMNEAWDRYNQVQGPRDSYYAEEAIMGVSPWVTPSGQQVWLPTQYSNYGIYNGTIYGW